MHTILSPEDLIFWVVTGKIHAQMKPQENQMRNEIIEQKDSSFSNTPSFSVTLCCPVTCIDNSSWIKCQHYHRQLCCWHAFAISLKIPLIFWLHNSWATPIWIYKRVFCLSQIKSVPVNDFHFASYTILSYTVFLNPPYLNVMCAISPVQNTSSIKNVSPPPSWEGEIQKLSICVTAFLTSKTSEGKKSSVAF